MSTLLKSIVSVHSRVDMQSALTLPHPLLSLNGFDKISTKQIKTLPFTHARKLNSPPTKLNYLLVASNSSAKKGLQVMADDEYALLSGADPGSFGKILLSDVVVRRRRQAFWGRKWNSLDIENAVGILAMHVLCLCAPFYFTWTALWVAYGLYVVTGLGITLSFHRNLSHRSFKLPKWLEYFFAYCGVQALQRDPIFWVSTHRHHHQFCDSERDPHSPTEGFWFSHMGWLFDANYITEKCGGPSNVEDLEKQPFYKFMQDTYFLHPIAFGVLLYAWGGFPFLVWGMGVRITLGFHITWLVNSVSHIWGKQAWNTGDLSRNNWWLALLTFGEGWHNNHHAFEYSARHGLKWWQIDITWYVVRFLQAIGLATDVKVPSEVQKQRMAFEKEAFQPEPIS